MVEVMLGLRRLIVTLLLMLLVGFPAVSLSYLAAERVIHPGLSTPPGVDVAEALFIFEEILLEHRYRVIRHEYHDEPPVALLMEIMDAEAQMHKPLLSGPTYIFRFEVHSELLRETVLGEMVLQYDSKTEVLVFEAARFEEKYGNPGDTAYFERVAEGLLGGVIRDIEGRLK
jgi:hypothetical protein